MKDFKIVPENMQTIEKLLAEYQKNCKVRTVNYDILLKSLDKVETMFHGVPKSAMVGMEITIDYWAEDFPNAYLHKGRPESTFICIVRKTAGWYLRKIYRDYTRRASRAITVDCMPFAVEKALINMHTCFPIY